jgi:hypothetical protein
VTTSDNDTMKDIHHAWLRRGLALATVAGLSLAGSARALASPPSFVPLNTPAGWVYDGCGAAIQFGPFGTASYGEIMNFTTTGVVNCFALSVRVTGSLGSSFGSATAPVAPNTWYGGSVLESLARVRFTVHSSRGCEAVAEYDNTGHLIDFHLNPGPGDCPSS